MPAAQWNLVVEMLNLTKTNWLNKQAPGNNLQIEVQINLTFLHSVDSSDKTNPTSKCNADK